VITTPIHEQSQPEHATTDHSSTTTRPTTDDRTAHLGITIRWVTNQDKSGRRPYVLVAPVFDLERVV
jgi:hypothetical protein